MLFADPKIALTSEYLRLLESLAAAASESGQLAGGALYAASEGAGQRQWRDCGQLGAGRESAFR